MKKLEKKIKGYNVSFRKFAGIDEIVRYVENTPADDGFRDVVSGTHELRKGFNGVDSYEEARDAIKKGVNVKEIICAINTGKRDYGKKRNVRHISGGAPCVPAAVASDPRAMYMKRNERITGAYNIYINTCYNCGVTPSQAREAGIKVLKEVIRIAEIKPVNLYCGGTAIDNERRNILGYSMQIMDAGKAFNAARVSYALTEAGFFRVFGFSMYERSGGLWSRGNASTLGSALQKHSAELNRQVLNATFKNMLFVDIADVIDGKSDALKELEAIK